MVAHLSRQGGLVAFGIKALYDLFVDPGGVLQVVPIRERVIPVDDQDVEGVRLEVVEVDMRWKVRLVDRFILKPPY